MGSILNCAGVLAIAQLRGFARAYDDPAMVAICDSALDGDEVAAGECFLFLQNSHPMVGSQKPIYLGSVRKPMGLW